MYCFSIWQSRPEFQGYRFFFLFTRFCMVPAWL